MADVLAEGDEQVVDLDPPPFGEDLFQGVLGLLGRLRPHQAEAVIYDKRKIIPVCVELEGEYGVNGLFAGVPCIIGRNGIEKVIELDLTDEEKAAFAKSMAGVGKTCAEAEEMLKNL